MVETALPNPSGDDNSALKIKQGLAPTSGEVFLHWLLRKLRIHSMSRILVALSLVGTSPLGPHLTLCTVTHPEWTKFTGCTSTDGGWNH